jgi:hypothetical protein
MATAIGIPGFANKWYYNTETGQLENTSQALAVTSNLGLAGWHELNIPGSDTGAQAAAAAKKEFPTAKTPTYAPVTPASVAAGAAADAGLTGLNAIGDFASRLTQAHTWERVAEVLLGVILIAVGLAHMTRAVPIATAIAAKVP